MVSDVDELERFLAESGAPTSEARDWPELVRLKGRIVAALARGEEGPAAGAGDAYEVCSLPSMGVGSAGGSLLETL